MSNSSNQIIPIPFNSLVGKGAGTAALAKRGLNELLLLGADELFEKALKAKSQAQFSDYFELLEQAVERDPRHLDARVEVAWAYWNGKGTAQNRALGAVWYKQAAEQGHLRAQTILGSIYSSGDGLPRDPAQGVVWYQKAAEQGDGSAQRLLGFAYLLGDGVPEDSAQAAAWFRKAADQGFEDAQRELGWLYFKGDGVPRDLNQAALLLSSPAKHGDFVAQGYLDRVLRELQRP